MIKLWLHSLISNHTGVRTDWELTADGDAQTLRAALEPVFEQHRLLRQSIVDETGALRTHINIFIGNTNVRKLEGLETVVKAGDEISIFPSVSGG